jgi:phosphoglycerol transferase MdoB-like AlkP superfamily enzyme
MKVFTTCMNKVLHDKTIERGKLMDVALFYLVACLFMAISALLSGIQWNEANGVREYLRLIFLNKPFIVVVTIAVFVLSGMLMQIGKHYFHLSYYKVSIIWLATSWVAMATLWLAKGIRPSSSEFIGILFCHVGLAVSTLAGV